jgi:hypothetical protein
MVSHLLTLARRCPEWEIVLKPRVAPREATFHHVAEHISTTLARLTPRPPSNLRLSYEPLPSLLGASRLFATLSSTAFFDALDHGCIPLVLGDFGVRADLGTAFFAGSGMLIELGRQHSLEALCEREVDAAWLDWVGYGPQYSSRRLFEILSAPRQTPQDAVSPPSLQACGYVVNSADLSSNQLRIGAEQAIDARDYDEAAKLLEMAALQRPDNANIRRRLGAVRIRNRLWRRILLLATPRFKL